MHGEALNSKQLKAASLSSANAQRLPDRQLYRRKIGVRELLAAIIRNIEDVESKILLGCHLRKHDVEVETESVLAILYASPSRSLVRNSKSSSCPMTGCPVTRVGAGEIVLRLIPKSGFEAA